MPAQVTRVKLSNPATVALVEERIKSSAGPISLAVVTIISDKDVTDKLTPLDFNPVGCAVRVLKAERSKDLSARLDVMIEGVSRVRILGYTKETPYFVAKVEFVPEPGMFRWYYSPLESYVMISEIKQRSPRVTRRWRRWCRT